MRRFRFRLDGLLRLRSQLERQARRSLATATGEVGQVEQRMAVAADGLRQCEDASAGNDAQARLARALATGLGRHRLRLQHELRAAEARLDRARTEWLERSREERALAQLRDRRREAWRQEALRGEQAELEELARRPRSRASEETP